MATSRKDETIIRVEEVVLMLAAEAQRPLICWEPVNSRIISAQFATQNENIKRITIQCYTLTNYAIEEKKRRPAKEGCGPSQRKTCLYSTREG